MSRPTVYPRARWLAGRLQIASDHTNCLNNQTTSGGENNNVTEVVEPYLLLRWFGVGAVPYAVAEVVGADQQSHHLRRHTLHLLTHLHTVVATQPHHIASVVHLGQFQGCEVRSTSCMKRRSVRIGIVRKTPAVPSHPKISNHQSNRVPVTPGGADGISRQKRFTCQQAKALHEVCTNANKGLHKVMSGVNFCTLWSLWCVT